MTDPPRHSQLPQMSTPLNGNTLKCQLPQMATPSNVNTLKCQHPQISTPSQGNAAPRHLDAPPPCEAAIPVFKPSLKHPRHAPRKEAQPGFGGGVGIYVGGGKKKQARAGIPRRAGRTGPPRGRGRARSGPAWSRGAAGGKKKTGKSLGRLAGTARACRRARTASTHERVRIPALIKFS